MNAPNTALSSASNPQHRQQATGDPPWVALLRTLVLMFALSAFAWELTTWVGQAAIVIGSGVGGLMAQRFARPGRPLWKAWGAAALAAMGGLVLSWVFTESTATSFFNPKTQLHFAEWFRCGGLAFAVVSALRATTQRYPSLVALELVVAAGCMASSLAMHRDGAINRPTALGDWAWSQGHDPAKYILYAGCVASSAGLLMLMRERSMLRTGLHVSVIALIFAAVLSVVGDLDLPDPTSVANSKWDGSERELDDIDIDDVHGPTRDPDPGGASGGKEGQADRGQRNEPGDKGRQDPNERDGDKGQGQENDPWNEFDQEYISENYGQGEGEGQGSGSGSGSSRRPFDENFSPDTDNGDQENTGASTIQVYSPEIVPFERHNVFDAIDADGNLGHRQEKRKPLRVGKRARKPVAPFDGDVRLWVRPGAVTPLPSVSPDMEILEYTTEPKDIDITFSKNKAGNFWVTSSYSGIVRIQFKVEASMSYFGGDVPMNLEWKRIPRPLVVPIPAKLGAEAQEIAAHIGVSREMPLSQVFMTLVEYFRSWEDVEIPDTPEGMSMYTHLSLQRKGVCRHRAYAYTITANALGLPTYMVTNDLHAFSETWLPGVGWYRVDLGGRELDINVSSPSDSQPFIPPRSNLPQPQSYQQNKEAGEKALRDPKNRRKLRRRKARKRLTPEEYAAKYPDRCRKLRKRKRRPSDPKHQWDFKRGAAAPVEVFVLHGDYAPPSGAYYFPQRALSFFDGCTFRTSRRRDTDLDLLTRYPSRDPITIREPPPHQDRSPLELTAGSLVPRRIPVTLEGATEATRITNPDPGRFRQVMRVEHVVQTTPFGNLLGRDVGHDAWSNTLRRHYTRAPINPQYKELADSLVAKLPKSRQGDPLAQAAAILTHLETIGVYDESASWADAETEDPVARMLFDDTSEHHGHALHFASAMALLLRARGIPSRLVEGYVSPEANRRGGSAIMLRELDAHVWPEIYVRDLGWIPVDVAPQRSVSAGVPAPDAELQRMLGEMLRGQIAPKDEASSAPVSAQRSLSNLSRGLLKLVLAVVLLIAGLILPVTLGAKAWRRQRARACAPEDAWKMVYRASLDRMAEAGLVRHHGETREAFARRLERTVPSLAPLTRAHLSGFFDSPSGEHARTREGHAEQLKHAEAIARELRDVAPWWRRLLGLLNPLTLWQAR